MKICQVKVYIQWQFSRYRKASRDTFLMNNSIKVQKFEKEHESKKKDKFKISQST